MVALRSRAVCLSVEVRLLLEAEGITTVIIAEMMAMTMISSSSVKAACRVRSGRALGFELVVVCDVIVISKNGVGSGGDDVVEEFGLSQLAWVVVLVGIMPWIEWDGGTFYVGAVPVVYLWIEDESVEAFVGVRVSADVLFEEVHCYAEGSDDGLASGDDSCLL